MSEKCHICNRNDCKIRNEYGKIIQAWINNESMSDIYHMILNFITTYNNNNIKNNKILDIFQDIAKRMEDNESTNSIVEDFIYGQKYSLLKSEYS